MMKNKDKSIAATRRKKAEEKLNKIGIQTKIPNSKDEIMNLIHELEVHQIELEMQNEELQMQKEEIQEEKDISDDATEKYRNLFDFAPSGYFSMDSEGKIIDLNLNAAEKLGKERSKLINSRFGFFLTEESKPVFNSFLEKLFSDNLKAACELSFYTSDKDTVYYHITGIHTKNDQLCFLSALDITERKISEKYREMTREILQILNEPGTIKDAIHSTLTVLKTYTGFDAVGIRLKDNNDYPYLDQKGLSNEFMLSENSLLEFDKQGNLCRDKNGNPRLGCTCGLVISGKADKSNPYFTAGGSWWTNNSLPILDLPAKEDARFRPRNICIHEGYASIALVPIRNNSTVVGLIQFNDKKKNQFNLNTMEILEGMASHIGAAMMRKQVEESLKKSEERYKSIFQKSMSVMLVINPDTAEIMDVNQAACDFYGYSHVEFCAKVLTDLNFLSKELTISNLQKTKHEIQNKFAYKHKLSNNEVRYVEIYASPLEFNGSIALFAIIHDITERTELEEALVKLNIELDERIRERTSELIILNENLKIAEEK